MSGLISDELGWAWVFYLQGGACFVWVLLWIICVTNTPAQHPWISKEEVRYIEDGLEVVEDHVKAPPIPWSHMFRSMPFWAIFVANFGNNWGFHLLMTEIPEYMATMLGKDIEENALISTLPYACMWVFSFVFGFVFDKLYEKKCLTRTLVRKIATFVGKNKNYEIFPHHNSKNWLRAINIKELLFLSSCIPCNVLGWNLLRKM